MGEERGKQGVILEMIKWQYTKNEQIAEIFISFASYFTLDSLGRNNCNKNQPG